MTLESGRKYDVNSLTLVGWTEGDGTGADGYNVSDYFAADGSYLGPDAHGIVPIMELCPMKKRPGPPKGHPGWGGRPKGVKLTCGCGASLTASEWRAHFTACAARAALDPARAIYEKLDTDARAVGRRMARAEAGRTIPRKVGLAGVARGQKHQRTENKG